MPSIASLETDRFMFHYSIDPVEEQDKEYVLHGHSYYEVYLLLGGNVHYVVEGKRYDLSPGSLLLMRPGVLHGYKRLPGAPYERYALHFDEGYLFPGFEEELLRPFAQEGIDSGHHYGDVLPAGFSSLFETLVLCSKMERQAGLRTAKFATHSLLSHIAYMSLHENSAAPDESAASAVLEVIRYINENFTQPISLDQLSTTFFINKNHLNRVFRSVTGTTVMEYVIRKRIVYSQQLMRNGFSASDAGHRSGFGDYSSFFRAYCRINGHSPIHDRVHNIRVPGTGKDPDSEKPSLSQFFPDIPFEDRP